MSSWLQEHIFPDGWRMDDWRTLLRNVLIVLAYVAFGTVLIIVGDLVIWQGLVADAGALP